MPRETPALILFEPNGVESLGPPVDHRPVWELRVGALDLTERLERANIMVAGHWSRTALRDLCPPPAAELFQAGAVTLLSGDRLLAESDQRRRLADLGPGEEIRDEAGLAAKCLPGPEAADWLRALDGEGRDLSPDPGKEAAAGELGSVLRFWWESFELAATTLSNDLTLLLTHGEWHNPKRKDWIASESVWLAAGAELGAGVVIDASGGAVLIDRDVKVGPGSFIQGPCYLGPGTRVKPLSQLLHGCFVGPQCRLGGEIEETQFQGFANKQHHGFLGHAWVGEWVNLGAGVTNSDLKNNYSDVRIRQRDRDLETCRRFVGCCLGDHVKVAIQGRINTGTVLEAFTNWFGTGFPDKGLPPFTWGGDEGVQSYDLERCLSTAGIVMSRRDRELNDALAQIYRSHHETSAAWRRERLGES